MHVLGRRLSHQRRYADGNRVHQFQHFFHVVSLYRDAIDDDSIAQFQSPYGCKISPSIPACAAVPATLFKMLAVEVPGENDIAVSGFPFASQHPVTVWSERQFGDASAVQQYAGPTR